jgi:hypothetical protein
MRSRFTVPNVIPSNLATELTTPRVGIADIDNAALKQPFRPTYT